MKISVLNLKNKSVGDIDLESNIIILLGVVIVLVVHNLITKKEHFNINEQTVRLESQIDSLIAVAQALRSRSKAETEKPKEFVTISKSCPFKVTGTTPNLTVQELTGTQKAAIQAGLSPGFGSSLNKLNAQNIQDIFKPS